MLVARAVGHLRDLGVNKVVARVPSARHREILMRIMGFSHGNALVKILPSTNEVPDKEISGISFKPLGEEGDGLVHENWLKMWEEAGVNSSLIKPEHENMTMNFITEARASLHYQTFAAIDMQTGLPVGSVSCQVHAGTAPSSLCPRTGAVWAVYVQPKFRRRGIATHLMKNIFRYFEELSLQEISLIYASDAGRCVYEGLGFSKLDVLVLDSLSLKSLLVPFIPQTTYTDELWARQWELQDMMDELRCATMRSGVEPHLCDCMLRALIDSVPYQIDAISAANKDAVTLACLKSVRKAHRTVFKKKKELLHALCSASGKGFSIKDLNTPQLMAAKFDRLSAHWEEFVVSCGYSPVWSWLCNMAQRPLSHTNSQLSDGSRSLTVLDLCCGVGLPGQTLRLMGFTGRLVGSDISKGMLNKAALRCCYDELYIADSQTTLCVPDSTVDVVVCSGSIELLDVASVLRVCHRALRPRAELWVSFQWHEETFQENPTEHQSITGLSREQIIHHLTNAGFNTLETLECPKAFVTPKPQPSTTAVRLCDIPYIFCRCTRL
ncbi:GNAT family N-acetyltransferase [Pelomyxa schiedti]|nr:GNAT family N-acetyltransferase [Pelomyxa schiedti]